MTTDIIMRTTTTRGEILALFFPVRPIHFECDETQTNNNNNNNRYVGGEHFSLSLSLALCAFIDKTDRQAGRETRQKTIRLSTSMNGKKEKKNCRLLLTFRERAADDE
jgi:hypothetical protein